MVSIIIVMATVHHLYHGVDCDCKRCRESRGDKIVLPTNAKPGGYVRGGMNDPDVIESFKCR